MLRFRRDFILQGAYKPEIPLFIYFNVYEHLRPALLAICTTAVRDGGCAQFYVAVQGCSYMPWERWDGGAFLPQALPKEEFPDGVRGKSLIVLASQLLADIASELVHFCHKLWYYPPAQLSPLVLWLSQCQQEHGLWTAAAQPSNVEQASP